MPTSAHAEGDRRGGGGSCRPRGGRGGFAAARAASAAARSAWAARPRRRRPMRAAGCSAARGLGAPGRGSRSGCLGGPRPRCGAGPRGRRAARFLGAALRRASRSRRRARARARRGRRGRTRRSAGCAIVGSHQKLSACAGRTRAGGRPRANPGRPRTLAGALGCHLRRQAFVIGLNRHIEQLAELRRKCARDAACPPSSPGRETGKPTTTRSASCSATSLAIRRGIGRRNRARAAAPASRWGPRSRSRSGPFRGRAPALASLRHSVRSLQPGSIASRAAASASSSLLGIAAARLGDVRRGRRRPRRRAAAASPIDLGGRQPLLDRGLAEARDEARPCRRSRRRARPRRRRARA